MDKIQEIISFKQNKWLEKVIIFNKQKRIRAEKFLQKDFLKVLNNAFHGKTMENVRNPLRLENF